MHLAEGSKGFFYWTWNAIREGPNAGAWSLRNVDGSVSERSQMAGRFGRMVRQHNELFYEMRPADTEVAIFDSFDAAIYLHRRSQHEPMWDWFVRNQYGFFKALRQNGLGCDFIDERGLLSDIRRRYRCIYLPFSMCMNEEIATAVRAYVAEGGTVIADCLTALATTGHGVYQEQPGAGLAEVFGLHASSFEVVYSGNSADPKENPLQCTLQPEQKPATPFLASKLLQPVEPGASTKVLYRDARGRPVVTVHPYGKGHAIWTGTLLGLGCRNSSSSARQHAAVTELFRPYITAPPWKLTADIHSINCRRLTSKQGDLFVLFNEDHMAFGKFHLDLGRHCTAQELLSPDAPAWRHTSDSSVAGSLAPLQGAVLFCPSGDQKKQP